MYSGVFICKSMRPSEEWCEIVYEPFFHLFVWESQAVLLESCVVTFYRQIAALIYYGDRIWWLAVNTVEFFLADVSKLQLRKIPVMALQKLYKINGLKYRFVVFVNKYNDSSSIFFRRSLNNSLKTNTVREGLKACRVILFPSLQCCLHGNKIK